ncbi:hypothetical protein QJQ45_023499 [Haematococcus lacustris]|nr:hypothetical protein QJQ45_023499 [Haematococcus lacustris]
MTMLNIPSWGLELETCRREYLAQGLYKEAGDVQKQLESQKKQEEQDKLQAMAQQHASEVLALEQQQALDYRASIEKWERAAAETKTNMEQQEASLLQRHRAELNSFIAQCKSEPVRPKWSTTLLNLRCQEEHLIKQRLFPQAARVKDTADSMERQEVGATMAAMTARHKLEEGKLLARHAKEMEALRNRLRMTWEEMLLQQDKELQQATKTAKNQKAALARTQALERSSLEQALKGWFSTVKPGFGNVPPLVSPTAKALSPGQRVQLDRPRRPGTAPGQGVRRQFSEQTMKAEMSGISQPGEAGAGAKEEDEGVSHSSPSMLSRRPRGLLSSPQPAGALARSGSSPSLHQALQPKQAGTAVGPATLGKPDSGSRPGGAAAGAGQLDRAGGAARVEALTSAALQTHTQLTAGDASSTQAAQGPKPGAARPPGQRGSSQTSSQQRTRIVVTPM